MSWDQGEDQYKQEVAVRGCDCLVEEGWGLKSCVKMRKNDNFRIKF